MDLKRDEMMIIVFNTCVLHASDTSQCVRRRGWTGTQSLRKTGVGGVLVGVRKTASRALLQAKLAQHSASSRNQNRKLRPVNGSMSPFITTLIMQKQKSNWRLWIIHAKYRFYSRSQPLCLYLNKLIALLKPKQSFCSTKSALLYFNPW